MQVQTAQQHEENKRQRFERLREKRLASALEDIRLIENLFQNPYAYQYDYKDVQYITNKLRDSINRLEHYNRPPPYGWEQFERNKQTN